MEWVRRERRTKWTTGAIRSRGGPRSRSVFTPPAGERGACPPRARRSGFLILGNPRRGGCGGPARSQQRGREWVTDRGSGSSTPCRWLPRSWACAARLARFRRVWCLLMDRAWQGAQSKRSEPRGQGDGARRAGRSEPMSGGRAGWASLAGSCLSLPWLRFGGGLGAPCVCPPHRRSKWS